MLSALLWGSVAASSLVIGAVLGVVRRWDIRLMGAVLGFGAGALISGVSFELVGEGLQAAGGGPVAVGLAAGARASHGVAADRSEGAHHDMKAAGRKSHTIVLVSSVTASPARPMEVLNVKRSTDCGVRLSSTYPATGLINWGQSPEDHSSVKTSRSLAS